MRKLIRGGQSSPNRVTPSRTKRSSDFLALLEEVDRHYGPKLGRMLKPIVLVLDNGPIHTSKMSRAALAARPLAHGRGAAEIRAGVERHRGSLARPEATSPRHQTFNGPDDLDRAIHEAVRKLDTERNRHPWANQQIAA